MRALLAGLIVLGIAPIAGAQDGAPRFEDYAVRETFGGPSKPPVLATKEQRAFRTRLREAAKEKPNFAGHYVLTTWGCGTECVTGAAIDARTGKVILLPFTLCCWGFDVPDDFEPIAFRLDSSLIVFRGARNEVEADKGNHYYTLVGGRLKELKSVK